MASLSQMLYCYNINREYQTQLQDLLANNGADDIVVNVEDQHPQRGKRKGSLIILFSIFLIYLFFVFICIITPSSKTTQLKKFPNMH